MSLHDRVNHRLKLRDLRLLLALDEWGSMAKAAAHLNLTQSGVSKAIAELEHTFGVRLYDRTPKGIEPTAYGRALLKGGVAVFDELRQSVNAIEHLADPTAGELRIGCAPPMSWGIVPVVIDRLVRQHPRLAFHVTEADPTTLRYHDLRERRIDLAIGRILGPIPDDDVDAEVLYNEKAFIVAGKNSRWAKRRKIELAELVDEPWCVPTPGSFAGSLLAEAFKEAACLSRMSTRCPSRSRFTTLCSRPAIFWACCRTRCFSSPRTSCVQSAADRTARPARASRDYHVEETDAEPASAAFHRARPRGREATGEAKMIDAVSAFGPKRTFRSPHSMSALEEVRSRASNGQNFPAGRRIGGRPRLPKALFLAGLARQRRVCGASPPRSTASWGAHLDLRPTGRPTRVSDLSGRPHALAWQLRVLKCRLHAHKNSPGADEVPGT